MDLEPEQLLCPICISLFTRPITLICGHSFCKQCLIISTKNKNLCPMCRKQLYCIVQKCKVDQVLDQCVEILKKQKNKIIRNKQNQKRQKNNIQKNIHNQKDSKINELVHQKITQLLLIDVRCSQLLLPYNKNIVTFQLDNNQLLDQLDNFVARQQSPYNDYGLLASVKYMQQLAHQIYMCTIELKSFCRIDQEWVQNQQDNSDAYYYRRCNVYQIFQQMDNKNTNEQVQLKDKFDKIYKKFQWIFKKINSKKLLQKVYKKIDRNYFIENNDPIRIYYSMLGILNIPDKQKYQIVTTFNNLLRLQQIDNYLSTFIKSSTNSQQKWSLIKPSQKLINIKNNNISILIYFIIATIIIVLILLNLNLNDTKNQKIGSQL